MGIEKVKEILSRKGQLSKDELGELQTELNNAGYTNNFSKYGADRSVGEMTCTDIAHFVKDHPDVLKDMNRNIFLRVKSHGFLKGQSLDSDQNEPPRKKTSSNFNKQSHNFYGTTAAKQMLAFIRKCEHNENNFKSGECYDMSFGSKNRGFTKMTINDVLAWQKRKKGHTAAGGYQIIRSTLLGLKKSMGLTGDELFDEEMQDRMGYKLLKERGFEKYLAGDMKRSSFMLRASKEWASMAKDSSGKSYYAGDGVNGHKSKISGSKTIAFLDNLLDMVEPAATYASAQTAQSTLSYAVTSRT